MKIVVVVCSIGGCGDVCYFDDLKVGFCNIGFGYYFFDCCVVVIDDCILSCSGCNGGYWWSKFCCVIVVDLVGW